MTSASGDVGGGAICPRTGKCAGRVRPTSMTAPHRYTHGDNSVKLVYMFLFTVLHTITKIIIMNLQ